MPSTSVITSCTVFAAITYLAMANPLPQGSGNMVSNPTYNGQGPVASGMGAGSMDSAGMGGNAMGSMGSGMGTPPKIPTASTSNSASPLPKSQASMNMDTSAMSGGTKPANSMSPSPNSATSRPITAGGMDQYTPQKNHTSYTPAASEMGSSGMGTDSYASGAGMYGNNSTGSNGSPNKHVPGTGNAVPTGSSSSTGLSSYLLEVTGTNSFMNLNE
ncbi:hypothetical protein PtA15_6A202 [Puccinia triticina]|uniref:Uncharacterized protein n=1 Tax=Puccinia triticina TaxID=208348 RepID=A0ABY7CK09_9BASI|nr:uncharacterized protein PtA15_6A202 [Puccinia triticina]WAQ85574.1 hypothetical protein PtA15_6A202 [Puccinia triticina]WAR55456.1 hypothetical protein PtB15_6B197 [Puccinia triticina]